MSARSSLLSTLPPETRDDAEKVYAELGDENATPDPRDFVAELHRRGLLSAGQLREAVLALEATRRIDRVESVVDEKRSTHAILGPLGAGAMGEVLLAKDDLGRVVAVKKLLPSMVSKKGVASRFFKEAQVTAQLDHPSIVPIHSLIKTDGQLAYAMKLVRGLTLEDYFDAAAEQWSKKGQIDEEHALQSRLERFLSVCDAIAYANQRGVVHRDLKPENIMVGAFGEVIVMDWGIAKLVEDPDSNVIDDNGDPPPTRPKQTRIGLLMGTPRYMSPEQAVGANDTLNAQSDQYALGIILHELVTLSPAVKGDLAIEECLAWARTARRQPYTVLHRKQPLPKQLLAIIDKACQLDPDKRYASVGAFAEDIRRHLRDEPILAKPDSMFDRLNRTVGRHRGKMVGLLMLVTSLGIVGVTLTSVFGVSALGAAQYRAQLSEDLLARVLRDTNAQALRLDAAFRDWNGQLNALAYAAEQALADETTSRVNPAASPEPPALKRSGRYRREVDLNWPSIGFSPNSQGRTDYRELVSLGPQLRATLADSKGLTASGRPGAQRNAIEGGVPIVWARVYTVDGYSAEYPGLSTKAEGVEDFRKEWWFKERQHERSILWHAPRIDPKKMGMVAAASRSLTDRVGNFLGIVRVDVSLQYVLDNLLTKPTWAERTYLIDSNKNVVLDSDDSPTTATQYVSRPLPLTELLPALKEEPSGSRQISYNGRTYHAIWAQLPSSGWTFVSLVPAGYGPSR